jgi:tRNA pseudouridine38-40 synthase
MGIHRGMTPHAPAADGTVLMLVVAYDGRPFSGWQSQTGGNTVQDHLARALEAVAKQPLRVHGAGRTDTGVHARGQVAHFQPPTGLSLNPYNWVPALNTKLPPTIRVLECREMPAGFHARFSATGKIYQYEIITDPVLPPWNAGLAWHLPRLLDADMLAAALALYTGTHDFHGFAAYRGNETPETDWRRTIRRAEVAAHANGYRITYEGDGFLYKMARMLTGAAVHAAQGRIALGDLAALLDQPPGLPRGKSPVCAPADGLFLDRVIYPPELPCG